MPDEAYKEDDEIELMDLFLVLWRRKSIIIGVVIFSMVCAVLLVTFQKKELRTEMVVALNFEGIDKGVYPDGNLFESMDIVSPDVVNRLGLDIDLSGHLFVEEIVPDPVKAKIKKNPEFIYYPNRFKIVLVENDKILFSGDKEKGEVLKAIIKAYKDDFEEKYIDQPVVLFTFPKNFVQTVEYDDIIYTFNETINEIQASLIRGRETTGAFRSRKNGFSFSEILSELVMLKEIDLRDSIAKINTFHLARDKQSLIAKIEDRIRNTEYEKEKNEKMAELSFKLLKAVTANNDSEQVEKINSAGQSTTQFLLDSSVLEKLEKNDYVFYLIKLNLEHKTNAINNGSEIKKFKDRVDGLKKKGTDSTITDNDMIRILSSLENKIMEISQKANMLNREYLESKFSNTIRSNNTPESEMNYGYAPKLVLLLTFVGALFFSVFLSFLVDYMIRYRKNS
jgi:Chain length determinant protein